MAQPNMKLLLRVGGGALLASLLLACSESAVSIDPSFIEEDSGVIDDAATAPPDAHLRPDVESDSAATPRANQPIFSPQGGTFAGPQTVTIASSTKGATIFYSLDGNPPSASSSKYTAPINVTSTATIIAFASAPGYADSPIFQAKYTIVPLPAATAPVIAPSGGSFTSSQQVTMTTTEPSGAVVFTVDGTPPTGSNGTVYTAPITVAQDTTIIAITRAVNRSDSSPVTATFKVTIPLGTVTPPSISPPAGEYTGPQTLSMSTSTPNATVCYTIDGNTPTCDNTKPVTSMCTGTSMRFDAQAQPTLDGNKTVKAIACLANYASSTTTTAGITFRSAVPTLPSSGSYAYELIGNATISTPGATLLYTTTGSDPDVSFASSCSPKSGTQAAAVPWDIAKALGSTTTATSGTYKFRSCKVGYSLSAVTTANYTIAKAPCVPQCTGKVCGSDSCGGSCGTCSGSATCNASGTACFVPCVPTCTSNSLCGDSDGCGGTCKGGGCPSGYACTAEGNGYACLYPCNSNYDCSTGKCEQTLKLCSSCLSTSSLNQCSFNSDCCSKLCSNGKCITCKIDNDSCTSSSQCCSGTCSSGKCK